MRRLARIIVRSENRRSDNRHSGAARASCEPTSANRRNDIVAALARISMADETGANRGGGGGEGDMENKL